MKNLLKPVGTVNPIREYWHDIQCGRTIVCQKIRKVYQKLIQDMDDTDCLWEYDARRADHAIIFIQTFCHHSKGREFGGKPFILERWEQAAVASIFGFVDKKTKVRRFTEAWLMLGRKNGKSTLAAAIGLYLMIADQEPGAEIYAVASTEKQAMAIWNEAKRMVKKSTVLAKKVKALLKQLSCELNDSSFEPLHSKSENLDGLNVHGGLMDEVHAWKDINLYDVIVDGAGARTQPLILVTTTSGFVREAVLDIKYAEIENIIASYDDDVCVNNHLLPLIYELDQRDEWKDPNAWVKANPGLGTIKRLDLLAEKVRLAKINPLRVRNLVTKDFNLPESDLESFLAYEDLYNPARFNLKELNPKARYCIGGADLSETTDLCSAGILFRTGPQSQLYYACMFWLPEDLLEARVKDDKIRYDIWKDQGLLRTVPGNKIHPHYVTEWFKEIRDEYDIWLSFVGYDAWAAQYWVEDMTKEFGPKIMEPVRQGAMTLSTPCKELKADLRSKLINYDNNPILKWNMNNVKVKVDDNENYVPRKKRSRARIDGFMALLDAYVVYLRHLDEYTQDIGG